MKFIKFFLTTLWLFSFSSHCFAKEPLYLRLLTDFSDEDLSELDHLSTNEKKEVASSIILNREKISSKYDSHSIDSKAIKIFKRIKPEAIPFLVDAFNNDSHKIRNFASYCLGNVGPEAVQPILETFKDKNPRVRYCGISAVVFLNGDESTDDKIPEVIQALINLLDDPDISVRDNACRTFGAFGTAATPAVPFLVKLLKDKSPKIRHDTLHALGMIGSSTKDSIPIIAAMLHSEDTNTRVEAAYALSEFDGASKPALPDLLQALHDPEENVRVGVINTLGNIGPDVKEAVPSLIKNLEDQSEGIRWESAMALVDIDPSKGDLCIPVFIQMFKNDVMKDTARTYLKKIGTPKAIKCLESR